MPEGLPDTVDGMIDMLDRAFPDKCPALAMSDREIWMAVGARRVVEFLRSRQEEDQT